MKQPFSVSVGFGRLASKVLVQGLTEVCWFGVLLSSSGFALKGGFGFGLVV